MTPEEFLDALDAELKNRRYAARLKEDLAEHIDDMTTIAHLGGVMQNNAVLAHLGSPREIAHMYHAALRTSNPKFLLLESAIYGFLSLPIYFGTVTVGIMLLDGDGTSFAERAPYILAALFVMFVLLPAYNLFAMRHLLVLHEDAALRKTMFGALVAPALVFVVVMLLITLIRAELGDDMSEVFSMLMGPALGIVLTVLQYRLLSWLVSPAAPSTRRGKFQRHMARASKWLPLVSGVTLLLYVLATNAAMAAAAATQGELFDDVFLRLAFIGPRMIVEMITWVTYILLTFAFEFFETSTANLLGAAALLAGLLVIGAPLVRWLFDARRNVRHFPWLAPAALAFASYLLFTAPLDVPHIQWHVPALNASEVIERQQLGPLYRVVNYFNRNEGRFARYWAGNVNKGFGVVQIGGSTYYVTIVDELDAADLVKYDEQILGLGGFSPLMTSDGVTCNGTAAITKLHDHDIAFVTDDSENFWYPGCTELAYNGRAIATLTTGAFAGLTVSPDGTFAAIKISTGVYDPNFVYIVDLR